MRLPQGRVEAIAGFVMVDALQALALGQRRADTERLGIVGRRGIGFYVPRLR